MSDKARYRRQDVKIIVRKVQIYRRAPMKGDARYESSYKDKKDETNYIFKARPQLGRRQKTKQGKYYILKKNISFEEL